MWNVPRGFACNLPFILLKMFHPSFSFFLSLRILLFGTDVTLTTHFPPQDLLAPAHYQSLWHCAFICTTVALCWNPQGAGPDNQTLGSRIECSTICPLSLPMFSHVLSLICWQYLSGFWWLWLWPGPELLTLWLWSGTQGCDLEGPVGLALRQRDFDALLWWHHDVRLRLGDGRQELVHVSFLLLEELVCRKAQKANWDDLAHARLASGGNLQNESFSNYC